MAVGTRQDVVRASVVTFAVPVVLVVVIMAVTFVAARSAEGWGGLGYVIFGLMVAAGVGLVAVVVTATVAFRRALPVGQRLRPALAAVVGVVALVASAVPFGPVALQGTAALLLLPLPVLLPLAVTGHMRWRWLAALLAAAVAVTLVTRAVDGMQRDDGLRADLAVLGDRLPLTGGASLDSPLPGWELLSTDVPTPGTGAPLRVQWRYGAGTPDEDNYVLEVDQDATGCTAEGTEVPCTVLGSGAHGDVTRYTGAVTYVFVRVGDLEWQVQGLDDAQATTVLESLEAVDADAFWAAVEGTPGLR
jgi:hypothetical protein